MTTPQDDAHALFATLDRLLESMIDQQRAKVLRTAQRLRPNVTDDDLFDPHSIPEIADHPGFTFEDGLLAGLVAARVALTRETGEFVRKRGK
jgi:hypothetical protein